MLVAPTTMYLAYRSILALRAGHCRLLFCISFAEHCVLDLSTVFTSALVAGQFEYIHVIEGVKTFAE